MVTARKIAPLVLMERGTGYRVEEEDLPRIVGCMTGAANDVSERLVKIDLPAKVSRFIHRLERLTFGHAGTYQARGEEDPGSWCHFAMPEWAEALKMSSAQVIHLRQRLIDDGLIWYELQEGKKGIGRIGWNLNFDEWKPLQPGYRAWGGKRAGAGRPRKNPVPAQNFVDNLNIVPSDFVDNLNYEQATSGATAITPASGLATGRNQDVNENYSRNQRNLFKSSTKNGTFEGAGASPEAAPSGQKIKSVISKNKEETYTETTSLMAADADHAAQDGLFPEAQPATPPKRQRKPDLLWEKAVELFHQPMGGEIKNWRYNIVPELHRQGITPEQLAAAAKRYKEKYPKATCSLKAVFNNLGDLLDAAAAPIAGVASTYRAFEGYSWEGGH